MRCDYDIVIAGGGMVGASLAVALAPLPVRIAVAEAFPFRSRRQPSFDDRATAVSLGSKAIFDSLGLWQAVAPAAIPIRQIHVSDRGHFGFTRICCREQGVPALGYVVENRTLGAALWKRLGQLDAVEVLTPAQVCSVTLENESARLGWRFDGGDEDSATEISARLLVAADGAHSTVRELLGVAATTWEYDQTALIANVRTHRPHHSVAYERFTEEGPLAFLPMSDNRCTVVWTVRSERAEDILGLEDDAFLAALQAAFGYRLGKLQRAGKRQAYPLRLVRAEQQVRERLALIGNAAHGVHPVAGQGFNLGLRDVAALAEAIAVGLARDRDADQAGDPGSAAILESYADWRRIDQRDVVVFTDGLVRLFRNPLGVVRTARNLGLLAIDLLPFAKNALARRAMGRAGRLPRLARRLPLT